MFQSGFTLLEVLVATAILAIALSAIVGEASQNVKTASYLQDKTLAQWVALNKVAEVQVSGKKPRIGSDDGEMLLAEHDWYWETKTYKFEGSNVLRMDVEVWADRDTENPLASVISYVGP